MTLAVVASSHNFVPDPLLMAPRNWSERLVARAIHPSYSEITQKVHKIGLVILAALIVLTTFGFGLFLVDKVYQDYSNYQERIAKAQIPPLPVPPKPVLQQRSEVTVIVSAPAISLAPPGNNSGIPNLGCTCYVNSTLQLIASSSSFDEMLLAAPSVAAQKLQEKLRNLVNKIRRGASISKAEAAGFYHLLGERGWAATAGQQCDQSEFFNWLLGLLPNAPTFVLSSEISRDNGGSWEHLESQPTHILPLNIPAEAISDRKNMVAGLPLLVETTFSSDGTGSCRRRDCLTGTPPQMLAASLQRTMFENNQPGRYEGKLALFEPHNSRPVNLTLQFGNETVTYASKAISLKTGGAGSGHYRTLVQNREREWVVMNDHRIQQPYPNDANLNGYVIIYERVI